MAYFRRGIDRGLAVCLMIIAALGGEFALALLTTALSGNSTPSSILLGGLGFIFLVISVLVLVFALRQWTPTKPGRES
jgi:hypothetical protein